MDRFTAMIAKMLAPPVAIIVCTLTAMWVLSRGVDNPFLVGLLRAAYWLPALPLAIALAWIAWASYRLWKWARGEANTCECGGLLGSDRDGRYGPYRRCLACNRTVARRHYA